MNHRMLIAMLLVLVLTIVPLPYFLMAFRPPWVLMFILFVQFFMPSYFHVGMIFLLGICLDVLLSTVMGEHAFALLMTAWIAHGRARRFYFFSMVQQMVFVLIFSLSYFTMLYVIDAFLGNQTHGLIVVAASCVSMMFWPWFQWAMMKTIQVDVKA